MPETELLTLTAVGVGPLAPCELSFGPGFNVLTGETGVGKTLLVGALSLCLGADNVRGLGRDGEFRVGALFHRGGDEISLTREVRGGRLRGTLDGVAASAEALRRAGSELVAIFGQSDSQRLRTRGEALRLIDGFGGIDDGPLLAARTTLRTIDDRRRELGGAPHEREREVAFLAYQLDEIERVAPTGPDELATTLSRLEALTTARAHRDDLAAAAALLDGETEPTALGLWSSALRMVPSGESFGGLSERLAAWLAEGREVAHELAALAESAAVDDDLMVTLEERAGVLQALARKFGGSLSSVFDEADQMRARMAQLVGTEAELAALDEQHVRAVAEVTAREAEIRAARERAASAFAVAVTAQLPRVALGSARVGARVDGVDGSDLELTFSPSPSAPEGPLAAMASGGELSRVLLAISLVTVTEGVVAVFDEVDAGIGGEVGQLVADCLHELSRRQQVVVVTHLAAIAARADHHFVVTRTDDAQSQVRALDHEQRVEEVARMLAGESGREESRALAERLLAAR